MKKTLIVNAEQMLAQYSKCMMSYLQDIFEHQLPGESGEQFISFGKNLRDMSSRTNGVALESFRNECWQGSTMMFFNDKDFKQIEDWYETKTDFQVAVFWNDGTPVGLLQLEDLAW